MRVGTLIFCTLLHGIRSGPPVHEVLHLRTAPDAWLHTLIHGEDDTLPVMLFIIGGQGTPVVSFEPRMRALAETFVYVSYTMRGVMGINDTVAPDGVQAHVDDAVWMVEYLHRRFGERRVLVSGLSYGADMALQVAARVPSLVSGVVCISGFFNVTENLELVHRHINARIPRPLVWLSQALGDTHAIGYIYKLYLTGVYGIIAYDCHEDWPCVPGTLIGPADVLSSPFVYSLWFGLRTVFEMSRCIQSFRDVHTLLPPATLNVPLYIFRGRYDLMANAHVADRYAKRVVAPAVRTVIFNRSTHFVPLEENDVFHAQMRRLPQWLAEDEPTGPGGGGCAAA